jgi:AAA15 family ATPase/GTPase
MRDVHVSRLRSIRESELTNLADFSVLAGLNNSGKSNFVEH